MSEPFASAHAPLVTVVIAAYNAERFLRQAVGSALRQTWPAIEVIVVDDGSSDATPALLEPYRKLPDFRYLRQDNAGQAAARNHGARVARGEYLAFLDADDWWADEKIALQMAVMQRDPGTGAVYSRMAWVDEDGRLIGEPEDRLYRGRISGPLFVKNFVGVSTVLVRRGLFELAGGFDESLRKCEDYDLWLRLSTRCRFDFVDRPLLYYRKWPGQMSQDVTDQYRTGQRVMARFLREQPGYVDRRSRNTGWAHLYVGLGMCAWHSERRVMAGMRWFARALRHRPTYLPGWRALAYVAWRSSRRP